MAHHTYRGAPIGTMTNVVASISLDRYENMHTAGANITAGAGARGRDIRGTTLEPWNHGTWNHLLGTGPRIREWRSYRYSSP